MLKGSSLNFLMQNVLPLMETSFMNVAASLCLSGSIPSRSGVALEMCFEDLWASLTMKSLAVCSSTKVMLVGMLSYFRCQTYTGLFTPLLLMSSMLGSSMMAWRAP